MLLLFFAVFSSLKNFQGDIIRFLEVHECHERISGEFGQSAKFGQRHCFFHFSVIGIIIELTKQTVKILMRLNWIFTVCKCMSEFTGCPK